MNRLTKWLTGIIFVMSSAASAQQAHADRLPLMKQDSVLISESFGTIGEFPQPRIYKKWLDEIAACENLPIDSTAFADVAYFVVNASYFSVPNSAFNYTFFAISNVYSHVLIVTLPKAWEESYIKHELLHFLLYWSFGEKYQKPGHQHPIEYFGKCNVRLGPFDK